jgi:hypothetical protein
MINDFTLILLTKNRENVLNSIQSIFKNIDEELDFKLLIIDGNLDNRIEILIKNNFYQYLKFIEIIKQNKNGFMKACFQSINHVKSNFFSFMYDDDILSPYYKEMLKKSLLHKKVSFGEGVVENIEKRTIFLKPTNKILSGKYILNKYYQAHLNKNLELPNSPICSIFRTSILNKWKDLLYKSCLKNKYYYLLLLKNNIGPDLLLYLLSSYNEKEIFYYKNYIAKFSHHKNSMSVIHGSVVLSLGYTLTKIIFFNEIKKSLKIVEKIKYKSYIIYKLIYLIIRNFFQRNNLNLPISNIAFLEIKKII